MNAGMGPTNPSLDELSWQRNNEIENVELG